MSRGNSFLFSSISEYMELQVDVFAYLQADIQKLLDKKQLFADFINFNKPSMSSIHHIYMRVYTLDPEDNITELEVNLDIPIYQYVYQNTRLVIDIKGGIPWETLPEIQVVKLRILYLIYETIKFVSDLQDDPKVVEAGRSHRWLMLNNDIDNNMSLEWRD